MAVQYNKLFKLMIDKGMNNQMLMEAASCSANIITRLRRNQYISMETIEKICIAMDCGVDDILDFIPEVKEGECNG